MVKITTNADKAKLLRDINSMELGFTCEIKPIHGTRTVTQNAALHASMRELASVLNVAGLTMQTVLKEGTEIEWTEAAVKRYMFHPVSLAMYGKESSAELNTVEMSGAWETMMRHLGEKFGVFVPFGSGND